VPKDISYESNAFATVEMSEYSGENVKKFVSVNGKIAGIAEIEAGVVSFNKSGKYPSLFFEKLDCFKLSVVSLGIADICENATLRFVENEEINALNEELRIIPRFPYPWRIGDERGIDDCFFKGTFRYRHRISTSISLRRFLYGIYNDVVKGMPDNFERREPEIPFSSFLGIKLLKSSFKDNWYNKLVNRLIE